MSDDVKRGRGRPPKTQAHDVDAIIKKIENERQRFAAKCADKLETLLDVIYDVAQDKNAPLKDRVKSADYCIKFAEEFLKESGEDKKDSKNKKPKEELPKQKAPLISLNSKD